MLNKCINKGERCPCARLKVSSKSAKEIISQILKWINKNDHLKKKMK